MSIIKVEDIEYVCFGAPDLARMRSFLTDFGMIDAEDSGDGVLRMRGTGPVPSIHEAVIEESGFACLALRAASFGDLQRLADAENVAVVSAPVPVAGARYR